jgi:CRISPR-associated protein Csx3
MPISFDTMETNNWTLLTFKLQGDLIDAAELKDVALPGSTASRRHLGLILSGRGPVWLFAHLMHLAHPFAWVATYDPRLNGAVVVSRHVTSAPGLGEVIYTDMS